VAPYGTVVQPIQSAGTGEAFIAALALYDSQMVKAILSQTLATEEGAHQARAAASVHQDVVDTIIRQGKRSLCKMLRQDVLRPWVRYNWGDQAARDLTPKATLGHAEEPDLPALWAGAAALKTAGYLAPSQYRALDQAINLPERLPEELAAQEQQLAQAVQQAVNGGQPGQLDQGQDAGQPGADQDPPEDKGAGAEASRAGR